jgi:actin-like ATPase involved in cell morphogenesis
MDRVLYVGTSAIMAGKSVKLQVAKPGKDGRIEAIEMFK